MRRRALLTIALRQPRYVEMAAALARSFHLWNAAADIDFVLVTDLPEYVPPDLSKHVVVERIRPGEFGDGYSVKLHLDSLAPSPATLFVDADSLCFGPVAPIFDRFAGRDVSTVGLRLSSGEWFGDVAARCGEFGVPALGRFIGGMYYVEPGARCSAVYAFAREIEARYDALGLPRMEGYPGDEPCVSIAMAAYGLEVLPDDGSVKAEPLNYPTSVAIDVFRGRAALSNDPGAPRHRADWPLARAEPTLVHFSGVWNRRHPYSTECVRLEKVLLERWPAAAARAYADLRHAAPAVVLASVKDALRPAYRSFRRSVEAVRPRVAAAK